MEFSDKINDKKEELLDEFENLTLDELAIKIKQISTRETEAISSVANRGWRSIVKNRY